MPNLIRRMHRNFRQSKAPYLRGFLAALETGLKMLDAKGWAAGLYLDSAREEALKDWSDVYRAPHGSEEEKKRYIKKEVLFRNRTTAPAISEAIKKATGWSCAIRSTQPHIARYDDLERMKQGYRMADYARERLVSGGILWGEDWGGEWPYLKHVVVEDDPTHLGYRGLTPSREVFGKGGFIVYMACEYDSQVEQLVLNVLNEQAPAAGGYAIFWVHTFELTAKDKLFMTDKERLNPVHGWGCAPFGYNWNTPNVTALCQEEDGN